MKSAVLAVACAQLAAPVAALDNGLARLPPMVPPFPGLPSPHPQGLP